MKPKQYIASPFISTLNQHQIMLDHFESEDGQAMSAMLNEKKMSAGDIGFTYRQINSWDQYNMLDSDRKGNEWRKFSIMDQIWLCLIREMRKFGLSRRQIAAIKEFLMAGRHYSMRPAILELFVTYAAPHKVPCVVVLFEDASALICKYDEWMAFQLADKVPNHVLVHVNPIFTEVFPKGKIAPDYKNPLALTEPDLKMLEIIRDNKFEKVEVTYKDGRAENLKGMRREKVTERITELLSKHEYQSIEIEQLGGNVSRILRWQNYKIKT